MKKIYIILVEPNETPIEMRDRIQNIGNVYRLYDSFIVCSEIQSAEELYNSIVRQDFNSEEIVVFELPLDKRCYFGYSDRDLWKWLSENIDNADGNNRQKEDEKKDDSSEGHTYYTNVSN